jgi:hypothetical protein
MRWYVSQNGTTAGPLSEQRIAMLASWGKISRDAYICDEQLSSWVAITRTAFAPLVANAPLKASARGLATTPLAASATTPASGAARPVFAGPQRHACVAAAVLLVTAFMLAISA